MPIIQYWHDDKLPDYLVSLASTFAEHNPTMEHRVFSRVDAEDLIADHFGDQQVAAFRQCRVASMQSDYFRFCAGLVFGGIYADIDFRCVGSLEPLVPESECGQLFRGSGGNVISGLFAFGSPQHPFLKLALEIATANISHRPFQHMGLTPSRQVYFTAGPPLFMTLKWLGQFDSFDTFLERLGKHMPAWRKILRVYCTTIGEHSRVNDALQGVEAFRSEESHRHVIESPGFPLPYKRTDDHWLNVKPPIWMPS